MIPQKEKYLISTEYMDWDHPEVLNYAKAHGKGKTPNDQAVRLYYAIRDGFKYNPYLLDLSKDGLKASDLLKRDYGYCIEKANLLATCCRALGIPARLGFVNVRNHLGIERIQALLKTDLLVFHGYTDLHLEGKWVKATPAFNKQLCDRYQVAPLDFDGENDSVFQEFTGDGKKFMKYEHEYGTFEDVPRELFIEMLKKHYPHMFNEKISTAPFEISGF